ncbi:hypothetical protein D3C87_1130210 [compost metagenome]
MTKPNKQKIFIVQHLDSEGADDIEAVFDERKKAEAFIKRFKTRAIMEIVEHVLNPEYLSDKTQDQYHIVLTQTGIVRAEVTVLNFINLSEQAVNEEYSIRKYNKTRIEEATMEIMLMASTPANALIRALAIRDEIVARGEWKFTNFKSLKNKL